MAFEKLKIN